MITIVDAAELRRLRACEIDVARRDAEIAGLNEICTLYRAELADAKEANAALQQQILELRREGFNPTALQEAPKTDAGPDLDPAIYATIRDLAKPGSDLYHELVEQAARESAQEIAPSQVCKNLRRGSSFNPLHA